MTQKGMFEDWMVAGLWVPHMFILAHVPVMASVFPEAQKAETGGLPERKHPGD